MEIKSGLQPQNLCTLKTLAEASGKSDQLSLNNMVFLAQNVFQLNAYYDDFRGLGKLGVSSPRLGWDYNRLEDDWDDISVSENEQIQIIRRLAKSFAHLLDADIALLACWLFDADFLGSDEKTKAQTIMQKLKQHIT